MKTALLLLIVAAVAVNSSVIAPRSNMSVGWVAAGDRLLSRTYVYRPPRANAVQTEDVVWRGAWNTKMSAVQATEVGATQFGNARIVGGGIGWNNVTVRFTSARGRGYYYTLDIWGR